MLGAGGEGGTGSISGAGGTNVAPRDTAQARTRIFRGKYSEMFPM